jgi:hypothetical protein
MKTKRPRRLFYFGSHWDYLNLFSNPSSRVLRVLGGL